MYELGGIIGGITVLSLATYKLGERFGRRTEQEELLKAIQDSFGERKVRMEGIDPKGNSVEYGIEYLLNEAMKKAGL